MREKDVDNLAKEVQNLRLELSNTNGEIKLLRQEIGNLKEGEVKGLKDKVKFLQTIIFSGIGLILTAVLTAIISGVIK